MYFSCVQLTKTPNHCFQPHPLPVRLFFHTHTPPPQQPAEALKHFGRLLIGADRRRTLIAHVGRARALDRLAAQRQDNQLLDAAIDAFRSLIAEFAVAMDDVELLEHGQRCIELMRFKGKPSRIYINNLYQSIIFACAATDFSDRSKSPRR